MVFYCKHYDFPRIHRVSGMWQTKSDLPLRQIRSERPDFTWHHHKLAYHRVGMQSGSVWEVLFGMNRDLVSRLHL